MSYRTPYPIPRSGLGKGAIVQQYCIPSMVVTGVTGQTAQDAMTTSEFTDFGAIGDIDTKAPKQITSGTIKAIRIRIVSNALSTDASVVIRKNGVNGNPLATIPAGTTADVYLKNVGFAFAVDDIIAVSVTETNSLNGQQLSFSMTIVVERDG